MPFFQRDFMAVTVLLYIAHISEFKVASATGELSLNVSITNYTAIYGTPITLICHVTPNPDYETVHVYWITLTNGVLAFLNAGHHGTEGMTIKQPSLTITRPTFDDIGEYSCNAKDIKGTVTGPPIQLNVIGGIPKVQITSETQIVEYGQPFTLDCNITSFPNHTGVYWQRMYNGTTSNIPSDYPGHSDNTTLFPSMTILKAVSSNSGLYTCVAVNIVGTGYSDAVHITVIGGIPKVEITSLTHVVEYGHTFTLDCNITSTPNYTTVYWQHLFNGTTLNITSDYFGLSENRTMHPSMTVLKARSADSGLYTCVAVNIVGTGYSDAVNVTIVGGIPKVEITPATQIVEYGQTFTLYCNISSLPYHTSLHWQKMSNGTTSNITSEYPGLSENTTMFPTMTILKAVSSDSGLYTCVAVNVVGTGYSDAVNVTVIGGIPKVEITAVTQIVEYGQPFTLECNITSIPDFTSVYWQRTYNGTRSNLTLNYVGLSNNTTMFPSMTILKAVSSDSGLYTCVVVNIAGTGYSDAVNVTVLGGIPKVEITSVTQIVEYGQPLTLDCNIKSFPNHTLVYWQRMSNGTTSNITSDYPGLTGNTTMFPSMTIINAVSSDSGLYTCYAVNIVGTGSSDDVRVTVIGGIPKVEITSVTQLVEYGQPLILDCNITSFPNHTSVYWHRTYNGTTSNITSDYPGLTGNTTMFPSMTILKAVSSDSGLYSCYAVNIVGTGSSDAVNVTVIGGIPKVEITSVTQLVEYGQPLTLDCNITSFPNHTSVYWQRMSYWTTSIITSDYPGLTGNTKMFPSMTILKAVSSDSGLYTCYAVNIVGTGSSDAVRVTVKGGIPKVETTSVTQIVEYGQPLTLDCNITSFPIHNFVYWQRISNGTVSYITSEYCRITGITTMFPSMTLLKAVAADSGLYTCYAVNIVGIGSSDAVNVTVIGGIPKVECTSEIQIVEYGQPFLLDCNITSFPNHTSVYWQRLYNGTTSNIMSDFSGLTDNATIFPSITILKAVSSDSGLYTCNAENIVGTGSSEAVNVTVIGGIPKVKITFMTPVVEYGQPFTLSCKVTSFPNYTSVYWQQLPHGTTSNETSDFSGLSDNTTMIPSITILKAVSSDSGLYTCYAVNIVGTGSSDAVNVTVIGDIPKVEVSPVTQIVEYGQPLKLDCNITSFPTHTSVYWKRLFNSKTLNTTSDYLEISYNTTMHHSMTILKAVSADSGLYTCNAVNIVGTGSSDAVNVTVIGDIPKVEISSVTKIVEFGQPLKLDCNITSFPNHTSVYWQRMSNGTTSNITSDYLGPFDNTTMYPSMTRLTAVLSDSGLYTCYAVNIVGTGYSDSVHVTVIGGIPKVEITAETQIVEYGQPFTLDCNITSFPNYTSVYWQRLSDDTTLNITSDYFRLSDNATMFPLMTILKAVSSDSGLYTCYAVNIVGTGYSDAVNVTVIGGIPKVEITAETQIVKYGQPFTLDCNITSFPNYTSVYWQRLSDDTTLNITSDYFRLSDNATMFPLMTILKAVSADSGLYTCTALNIVGTGYSDAVNVTVIGGNPSVVVDRNIYIEEYGNNITLECTVKSIPTFIHIYWQKISGESTENFTADTGVKDETGVKAKLFIFEGVPSDSGLYRCCAMNIAGFGHSDFINLTIHGGIPTVTAESDSLDIQYGQNHTIMCYIISIPAYTEVVWYKISNGIKTNITSYRPEFSDAALTNLSLTIFRAKSDDSGEYICYALNVAGTGTSNSINITVFGKENDPIVEIESNSYIVRIGDPLTIRCFVLQNEDYPVQNIHWELDNNGDLTNITAVINRTAGSTKAMSSFSVEVFTTINSGLYTCVATNKVGIRKSKPISVTVIGGLPVVKIPKNNYTFWYSDKVTLLCNVSADPPVRFVYWMKMFDGRKNTVINRDSIGIDGVSPDMPSLTLQFSTHVDSGIYRCFATNVIGTSGSESLHLQVIGEKPSVNVSVNSLFVKFGDQGKLVCNVDTELPLNVVYWEKKSKRGIRRISSWTIGTNGSSVDNPSLTILSSTSTDSGLYTCFAGNVVGKSHSSAINVTIIGERPSVHVSKNSLSVKFGDQVKLECSVNSKLPLNIVYWEKKSNGGITRISSWTIGTNGSSLDNPSLTIFYTTSTDSGLYTCFAGNVVGRNHSLAINVTVIGGLPVVSIGSANLTTIYGQNVTIECNVTADPPATFIFWRRNTNNIVSTLYDGTVGTKGISIKKPSLVLAYSTTEDSGSYTCFATNSVGTQKSLPVELLVEGDIPAVTIESDHYIGNLGQSIKLQCNIYATPPHTHVFWYKYVNGNTTVIDNGYTGTSGITLQSPSLTITSAAASETGHYTCLAENAAGIGKSQSTYLKILAHIPVVIVPIDTYKTGVDYSVTLTCLIDEVVPTVTHVYWQRYIDNAITVILPGRTSFGWFTIENPSLTILSATESMSGEYTCFAINNVSTGSSLPTSLEVDGGLKKTSASSESKNYLLAGLIISGIIASGTIASSVLAYITYCRKADKKNTQSEDTKIKNESNNGEQLQVYTEQNIYSKILDVKEPVCPHKCRLNDKDDGTMTNTDDTRLQKSNFLQTNNSDDNQLNATNGQPKSDAHEGLDDRLPYTNDNQSQPIEKTKDTELNYNETPTGFDNGGLTAEDKLNKPDNLENEDPDKSKIDENESSDADNIMNVDHDSNFGLNDKEDEDPDKSQIYEKKNSDADNNMNVDHDSNTEKIIENDNNEDLHSNNNDIYGDQLDKVGNDGNNSTA